MTTFTTRPLINFYTCSVALTVLVSHVTAASLGLFNTEDDRAQLKQMIGKTRYRVLLLKFTKHTPFCCLSVCVSVCVNFLVYSIT